MDGPDENASIFTKALFFFYLVAARIVEAFKR
jgi:hypothetical protein